MTTGPLPSRAQREELSRRLDGLHDASQTGVVAVCAVCGVSTQGHFVRGLRHDVQDDEVPRAAWYAATFEATGLSSGTA